MNEKRVQEKKPAGEGKRPPEKVMAHLKDWYEKSIERIKQGKAKNIPLEPVKKLKTASEGKPTYYNENGCRYEIPCEFCAEMYEKIVSAMFDGGYMEELGKLDENDLVVAAAYGHDEIEVAIKAANVIALENPARKEDLEFLIMSSHDEVRTMAKERYFEDDVELEIE